jgi:hypothetical protein
MRVRLWRYRSLQVTLQLLWKKTALLLIRYRRRYSTSDAAKAALTSSITNAIKNNQSKRNLRSSLAPKAGRKTSEELIPVSEAEAGLLIPSVDDSPKKERHSNSSSSTNLTELNQSNHNHPDTSGKMRYMLEKEALIFIEKDATHFEVLPRVPLAKFGSSNAKTLGFIDDGMEPTSILRRNILHLTRQSNLVLSAGHLDGR